MREYASISAGLLEYQFSRYDVIFRSLNAENAKDAGKNKKFFVPQRRADERVPAQKSLDQSALSRVKDATGKTSLSK